MSSTYTVNRLLWYGGEIGSLMIRILRKPSKNVMPVPYISK
jgi:hypothetical protein